MYDIFAVRSNNQDINDELLAKSLTALNHRGPDDTRIFKD
jgi:asparagine synthetase B (glutamine-hydrolysing)